jgi:hypothetical protein
MKGDDSVYLWQWNLEAMVNQNGEIVINVPIYVYVKRIPRPREWLKLV